jgi:hypothetical protein
MSTPRPSRAPNTPRRTPATSTRPSSPAPALGVALDLPSTVERVGLDLRLEAVRSATRDSVLGVAGDSLILRVATAQAVFIADAGPVRLAARGGLVEDTHRRRIATAWDLRVADAPVVERAQFGHTADLGGAVEASVFDGDLALEFAVTNGEGLAEAEQDATKNLGRHALRCAPARLGPRARGLGAGRAGHPRRRQHPRGCALRAARHPGAAGRGRRGVHTPRGHARPRRARRRRPRRVVAGAKCGTPTSACGRAMTAWTRTTRRAAPCRSASAAASIRHPSTRVRPVACASRSAHSTTPPRRAPCRGRCPEVTRFLLGFELLASGGT